MWLQPDSEYSRMCCDCRVLLKKWLFMQHVVWHSESTIISTRMREASCSKFECFEPTLSFKIYGTLTISFLTIYFFISSIFQSNSFHFISKSLQITPTLYRKKGICWSNKTSIRCIKNECPSYVSLSLMQWCSRASCWLVAISECRQLAASGSREPWIDWYIGYKLSTESNFIGIVLWILLYSGFVLYRVLCFSDLNPVVM